MIKVLLEYARMLNVSPSLSRLLQSFCSVPNFDRDARDYDRPLIVKRGGVLNYYCKEYEVRNDVEGFLLDALVDQRYEALYNQAAEFLRLHKSRVRFVVQFFEAVGSVDDRVVENFLRDKLFSLEKTFKNVYLKIVILILSNIEHEHFELLRNKLLEIVNTTCDDVEQCVLAIRNDDATPLSVGGDGGFPSDDASCVNKAALSASSGRKSSRRAAVSSATIKAQYRRSVDCSAERLFDNNYVVESSSVVAATAKKSEKVVAATAKKSEKLSKKRKRAPMTTPSSSACPDAATP